MIPVETLVVKQNGCEVAVMQALGYCDNRMYGAVAAGMFLGAAAVIVSYRLGLWYRDRKEHHS